MPWTIYTAPSDRDYYDQHCPIDPTEADTPCMHCGASGDSICEEWCPTNAPVKPPTKAMTKTLLQRLVPGIICCSAAFGGQIFIDSQPGLPTLGGPLTEAISLHPAWELNFPTNPATGTQSDAVWINALLSGYGDPEFQVPGGLTPVQSVLFDFLMPTAGNLKLHSWFDNAGSVWMDGSELLPPNFTSGTYCNGGTPGCVPASQGVIDQGLSAGAHQLVFTLYQFPLPGNDNTWANPSGLLFTGAATYADPTHTPEPATFGIGLALTGLAVLVRRVRKAKA